MLKYVTYTFLFYVANDAEKKFQKLKNFILEKTFCYVTKIKLQFLLAINWPTSLGMLPLIKLSIKCWSTSSYFFLNCCSPVLKGDRSVLWTGYCSTKAIHIQWSYFAISLFGRYLPPSCFLPFACDVVEHHHLGKWNFRQRTYIIQPKNISSAQTSLVKKKCSFVPGLF